MFSAKRNIQQLISLMAQHGIRNVVISPGSRNMPLAQSFANSRDFSCHPVTDERSAGFFAIGLSVSLNEPVAVCVTSGSALLNLTSAVSEAYYQQVPLLVLSADRPEMWIGQLDGQTLPQMGVFQNLLKKEVNLPEPTNADEEWHCNRLINEALLSLRHKSDGPAHINIPVSEPFFDCTSPVIPKERVIRRNAPYIDAWNDAKRPMLVIGQLPNLSAKELAEVIKNLDCPILCEHLSNIHTKEVIHNFDLILKNPKECLAPDFLIYIGGHLVSKRIKKWLRQIKPQNCLRITPDGECSDTFQSLTNIIEMEATDFLKTLPKKKEDTFLLQWKEASQKTEQSMQNHEWEYSSLSIVKRLIERLPDHSALALGNSSAVRFAQMFQLPHDTHVVCNRGVNGIDGSLSSAVGFAVGNPETLTLLIIGDLSFFYDMNALCFTQLPSNLRIVLLNNGGGEIFKLLPGFEINQGNEKYILATHQTSAEGWASSLRIQYLSIHNSEEVESNLRQLLQKSDKLILCEVFTQSETDKKMYDKIQKI